MDRNLYLFGAFLLAVILYACRDIDKSASDADKAILQQGPFKAISKRIRSFPTDALLYLQRAEMLSQQGMHELAQSDYKKAWELEPSETTALQYGNSLFMTGKWKQAVDFFEKAGNQYPENPIFKRRLGDALVQSGQTEAAFKQYDDILRVDSTQFEAWYEKGMLAASLGDSTQAVSCLEKSFQLMPTQTSGLALANLYAEMKNPRSLDVADQMIKMDTAQELVDPLFIKGIFYANTKNYSKAIEQFDACIKRDWKFNEAYLEKGMIFFEQKNIDEALRIFKLATTVSNTYADAYYWIGRCYETIGNKELAKDYFLKAYSLDPSFKEATERIKKLY